MKKLLLLIPILLISTITMADSVMKIPSNHGTAETMDRFEKIVKSKGLTVFTRINHRAAAKKVGMDMNDAEVILFGNPKMGTAIMKFDAAAGLELPLRVLVYNDNEGKTWISYHNPQSLKDNYDVAKSPALAKAEGALAKLTAKAAE